ncbi:hypothetical protein EJ07DRAFT_160169 [Lizonia empirigonia]|nr:hypothetical protein EJ07DRAFT_160169 [Lizonia empirigonia]
MRGRQLAAAFTIRQALPGMRAARLVVTLLAHAQQLSEQWPCQAGRLFQHCDARPAASSSWQPRHEPTVTKVVDQRAQNPIEGAGRGRGRKLAGVPGCTAAANELRSIRPGAAFANALSLSRPSAGFMLASRSTLPLYRTRTKPGLARSGRVTALAALLIGRATLLSYLTRFHCHVNPTYAVLRHHRTPPRRCSHDTALPHLPPLPQRTFLLSAAAALTDCRIPLVPSATAAQLHDNNNKHHPYLTFRRHILTSSTTTPLHANLVDHLPRCRRSLI